MCCKRSGLTANDFVCAIPMPTCSFPPCRLFVAALCLLGLAAGPLRAQIPAPVTTGEPNYHADGMTDQPFTLEVVDAHRTVSNTLLLRLAVTNRGTMPMTINYDFAGNSSPAELGRISALYAVDPNGRKKYEVLRATSGAALCSRIAPPLQPGERRVLYAQLAAPPDTTSSFDVYFPKTTPILNVPIGLPQAGEPIPTEASIGDPGAVPVPANPVQPGPSSAIDQPTSNNEPNVYTNQTNPVPNGSAGKAIGSVESANSTVPFTVEALGLKAPAGQRATLRLAFTNNGSGELIATGQFTGTGSDLASAQQITGLYLIDPATKLRFDIVRETPTNALCSRIDPPMKAGERRVLEATFPPIPATVRSVWVYFPHASQITDVPVIR